jgi:hypothetical protein
MRTRRGTRAKGVNGAKASSTPSMPTEVMMHEPNGCGSTPVYTPQTIRPRTLAVSQHQPPCFCYEENARSALGERVPKAGMESPKAPAA